MSLELLPGNAAVVVAAGMMGLLGGGAVGLEQCWGMLGETGSTLTMAGAELRQTGGDKTTVGGDRRGGCWLNSPNRKRPGVPEQFLQQPTWSGLVHGGQALQDEGLGWSGGLRDGEGGDTHRSGLDGGLGAQDCAGLQGGRAGQDCG